MPPSRSVEVADAAHAVGRLAVLDAAVGDARVPLRQAVEVADARPHVVGAGVDHAGDVDAGPSRYSFLRPDAGGSAACAPLDAADQPLDVAALDADLAQQLVDQRRLGAEAQRRVDDAVGEVAAGWLAVAVAAAAQPPRPSTCRILMPSMRSIGLTDSRMMRLGLLDQPQAQRRHARLGRQHVVRLVHQAQRLGLDLGAHPHRHRADLVGVGIGLGLRADRRAAVGAGGLLGLRGAR